MLTFLLEPFDLLRNVIMVDNQTAVKTAKTDVGGNRTKQIGIKHHKVTALLSERQFPLEYCSTNDMTGHIATKPLSEITFKNFATEIGLERCSPKSTVEIGAVLKIKILAALVRQRRKDNCFQK